MISALQEQYIKRIQSFSEELKSLDYKIRIASYVRLLIAFSSIIAFYFALTKNTDLFYLLLLLALSFTVLIFFHTRLFRKRDLVRNYIEINKNEIQYLTQNYSSFEEGKEFIDFSHPYTYDLDIFGESSLYQSLSRAVTYLGKITLAETLSKPDLSEVNIISKQEGIKEIKDKLDFRQLFQATGLLIKETSSDRDRLRSWLNENLYFLNQKYLPYVLYILPAFTSIFLVISIVQWQIHPMLTLAVICNWLLFGINSKKVNRLYFLISKKKLLLENYSELFKITSDEKFISTELEKLRSSLSNAGDQFNQLATYVGWLDQRMNILISPVLNSFFLYDLQCCYRIDKWRAKNDQNVLPWLNTLGKLDAFCSLGNFAHNNSDFSFPVFSTDRLSIHAKDLGHPLIKRNNRVPNDFDLGEGNHIAIITGANMAGKSTFLRTVGINIVLAYAGAPVCAAYLKVSLMDFVSSMRISDSLKDDVSYFYAELQRLKTIRQKVESGKPVLTLLDEMLRGTNSKDKQQGSKAFVENLLNFNCLALVATHDLLLGQLEQEHPSKIKNFCFESFLKENELEFDYKIRKGIAQNTNASFLMKNLGII